MKTIVYTAIIGDCDSLKTAPKGADRCVCFVDDAARFPETRGWELRTILLPIGADARREAWQIRCVPHLLFPEADRTVWIDASFTLTNLSLLLDHAGQAPIAALRHHRRSSCYDEGREIIKVGQARAQDVAAQLDAYRSDGYPGACLSISCILVRDRSVEAQMFNETWSQEIDRHPGDNTQLSLDYSAWLHGLSIRGLKGARHANPYSTHDHEDHKKRRRPYWVKA